MELCLLNNEEPAALTGALQPLRSADWWEFWESESHWSEIGGILRIGHQSPRKYIEYNFLSLCSVKFCLLETQQQGGLRARGKEDTFREKR